MSARTVSVQGPVIKPRDIQSRPSSALGNIQSHPIYTSGLYDKKCTNQDDTLNTSLKKSGTHIGFSKMAVHNIEPKDEIPKLRRRTIEMMDNIDITKFIGREMALALMKRNNFEKIEERIDLEALELLKNVFESAECDKNGKLRLDEFKNVLSEKLQLTKAEDKQTENLFKKIDWASTEAISWDDFCSFMQLQFSEKEDTYLKSREMAFNLPARVENTPHREAVFRITSTSDGTFIAGSTDGILSFWTSNLELKKSKHVLTSDQNQKLKQKWIIDFLIMTEFNKIIVGTGDREIEFFELSSFEPYCRIHSLETVPLCLDYHIDKDNSDDCILLWGDRQGCVNILHMHATGECLRTWKKQPRSEGIPGIGMESVLMHPAVSFTRWQIHNDWVLKLKYYDSLRQVISCSNDESTAMVIGSLKGSTQWLDQPGANQMKPPPFINNAAPVSTQVSTPPVGAAANTTQVTSGNNNTTNNKAFVRSTTTIVSSMKLRRKRMAADQTVFNIYKGIQTFDFGFSKNVLVTGGLDRIIRLWNPYVNSKPTGMLRGHNKPIVYLHIAEVDNRIYSLCGDKVIKVWDLHEHNCLLTVRPKSHRIRGDFQACHYSDYAKSLMIATDQMSMLNIKVNPYVAEKKIHDRNLESTYLGGSYFDKVSQTSLLVKRPPVLHTDVALTHKEAVNSCRYNPHFNLVVTGSEDGVIKLWSVNTGQRIFEYDDAHCPPGVTCMTFDNSQRRLITGGRDGIVRMWNFNNGHCLTEFVPNNFDTEESGRIIDEVRDVKYVEISRNKFIISVGWNKGINVYVDECHTSFMQQRYYSVPRWPDDRPDKSHRDDILSIACLHSHLLASGDYNGEIIVWNLMSGRIFFKLTAPPADIDEESDYLDEDLSINKLLFLQSRESIKTSASLVASGPYGLVHFWNVKQGGVLSARFKGGLEGGQSITSMVSCKSDKIEDKHLVIGDRFGFISVWDIGEYCMTGPEDSPPDLLRRWRAHIGAINDLEIAPEANVLVSCSDDRTARLWTLESGQFIGTFGQTHLWDVADPLTFQHPMVPFDVLIHPRSMPDHPVLGPRLSVEERKQKSRDEALTARRAKSAAVQNEDNESMAQYTVQKSQKYIDDVTINKWVNDKIYKEGKGKRLRYQRLKNSRTNIFDDGGPHEYRSLTVSNLENPPKHNKPELTSNKAK